MSGRPFKKSTMTKIIIVNILLFVIILCVYNQNRYKEEYEFENNSNVFSEIDRKFNIANIAKIIESPELDLEFICRNMPFISWIVHRKGPISHTRSRISLYIRH